MEASGMEVTVAQNGKEAVDFFAASEKDAGLCHDGQCLYLTLICRILTRKGDKFWLRFSPSLTIIFIVFDRAKTKKDLEERPDGKAECGHC